MINDHGSLLYLQDMRTFLQDMQYMIELCTGRVTAYVTAYIYNNDSMVNPYTYIRGKKTGVPRCRSAPAVND